MAVTNTLTADTVSEQIAGLGHPVHTTQVPIGTVFAECNQTGACDHLDPADRAAIVTIYGTETTAEVCLACVVAHLRDSFHVDTGNQPDRTTVEISVPATAENYAAASWTHPAQLAYVIDADGREGAVNGYDSVLHGGRRVAIDVRGEFDVDTREGRAALAAIAAAITDTLTTAGRAA